MLILRLTTAIHTPMLSQYAFSDLFSVHHLASQLCACEKSVQCDLWLKFQVFAIFFCDRITNVLTLNPSFSHISHKSPWNTGSTFILSLLEIFSSVTVQNGSEVTQNIMLSLDQQR